MADGPLVHISIRGADVALINGKVFAALISPPNGATWIANAAGNGTIQFIDQASGLVLGAPDTEVGTQATAAPPNVAAAVTSWIVTGFSDEGGDDATPITDPANLTSGYYTIQEPSSQGFLFRNRIEDYSLRPKVVALQDPSGGPFELVIQVAG